MKVKKECENPWCSKHFEAHSWDIRRNRGRFCSHKCVGEWLSIRRSSKPATKESKAMHHASMKSLGVK